MLLLGARDSAPRARAVLPLGNVVGSRGIRVVSISATLTKCHDAYGVYGLIRGPGENIVMPLNVNKFITLVSLAL